MNLFGKKISQEYANTSQNFGHNQKDKILSKKKIEIKLLTYEVEDEDAVNERSSFLNKSWANMIKTKNYKILISL